MAVERAQAGDLALQRRGRHGSSPLAALGQLGDESAQLGGADLERVQALTAQVGYVLLQVIAVSLEGVAGYASLELEVPQEVQREVADPRSCDGDAHRSYFGATAAGPAAGALRLAAWRCVC